MYIDSILQFVLYLEMLPMESETIASSQKAHRKRQAGSKLNKRKKKTPSDPNVTARQRNPKAFAFHSVNKVARQVRRFVVIFISTVLGSYRRSEFNRRQN